MWKQMTYHVYYTVLGNEDYTKVDSLDETVVLTRWTDRFLCLLDVFWVWDGWALDSFSTSNLSIMLDEDDNNDELIIKIEQYLLRQSFVYDLAE